MKIITFNKNKNKNKNKNPDIRWFEPTDVGNKGTTKMLCYVHLRGWTLKGPIGVMLGALYYNGK